VRTLGRTLVHLPAVTLAALACAHPARTPSADLPQVADSTQPAESRAVPRHAIAKLALGRGVVAVYASTDGGVEVGASAPRGSVVLHFQPAEVDAWIANTTRILARQARPARGDTDVAPATLTESGTRAGALTFERRTTRRSVRYTLFFANRNFGGFPLAITRQDIGALLAAMKKAAAAARAAADTTPPRPDTRTRPYTSRAPSPATARGASARAAPRSSARDARRWDSPARRSR
jgi:hypothetical protein